MRAPCSRDETRLEGSNRNPRYVGEPNRAGRVLKTGRRSILFFSLLVAGSRATREAPVRGDACSITRSINPSRDEYERVQPRSCP